MEIIVDKFFPSHEYKRMHGVIAHMISIKVEFVAYITGHGWGSAGCFNCAEFCNSKHIFSINGGVHEFETSFPNAASNKVKSK